MKKYMFAMLLSLIALVNTAQANVIVGNISDNKAAVNNCYPFGCAKGVGEYRQTYFSSNFNDVMNITSMSFSLVENPYGVPHTSVNNGFYVITMSWADDDGTFTNKGLNDKTLSHSAVVFQGSLPTLKSSNVFTIDFDKEYFFNPAEQTANGIQYHNLVMDVKWRGANYKGNPIMFVNGTDTYSAMEMSGNVKFTHNYGPQTEFATVPEPGSLALIGLGVMGLGALRRRRVAK